jgi:glutamate N-acetyltransferase/amino-acid N-acetyltransferase
VILNSGNANAATGAAGEADAERTCRLVADGLGCTPTEVLVCSTGLIGIPLPMDALESGIAPVVAGLHPDGGLAAAEAIMTTDTVSKTAVVDAGDWSIGGIAKGAGMLAPGLATMLVFLTTDADVSSAAADAALRAATRLTFDRLDSDGCMSTNDSVVLLASGSSGHRPEPERFTAALTALCRDLARQLQQDAEGADHDIDITVRGAATEADAVEVARSVARSNLFKCAIYGRDPNWGRILASIGTTSAIFDPADLDVALNGVWVCRQSRPGDDRDLVDLDARAVRVEIDLKSGAAEATIWTSDLTAAYVHANSAYAS